MQTISFSYKVGHSTVCGIIDDTCHVLATEYLKRPTSPEEWKFVSEAFKEKWDLPRCVGATDGKHTLMQAPTNSGSDFYNYKGTISIVLLVVCDARYCFTVVDIGDTGTHSSGGVFANSIFGQALENDNLSLPSPEPLTGQTIPLPYFFVSDAAFPLKKYMLRPYTGSLLPEGKQIFNYRLSRARRVIENTFGKFHIFRREIIAKPEKMTKITKAACCLHSYMYLRIAENTSPPS